MFGALIFFYLLLVAFLAYRSPRTALALLLATLPAYLIRFSVWGIPFTLLEATIWTITIFWFARNYKLHGRPTLSSPREVISPENPFRPYLFPILLWVIVSTVSILMSPNLVDALGVWKAYFIEPLLVFVLVVLEFRNRKERRWVPYALGLSVVGIGVVTIFQKLTGGFIPEPYLSAEVFKATSIYPYPNAVGLFVAPVLALYVAWLFYNIRRRNNGGLFFWKFIVAVLGILAISFARTKGAWIGALGGIFVGAVVYLKGWRRIILGLIIILAAVSVLLPVGLKDKLINEVTLRSPSGEMRLVVWEETKNLLKDNPIRGAGLAGYQKAIEPYHKDWRPEISPYKIEIFLYPHNVFLNFWVELGLAGLIVFLWLLAVFFYTVWQRRGQPFSTMALAAMVALLIHGLVDVPYFKNDLAILFWIILALPLLESRKVHTMHFGQTGFNRLVLGVKKIEPRVYDEHHQAIQVGDLLMCYPTHGSYECVRAEVVELVPRPRFTELLDELHPLDFGFENKEHALTVLRDIYDEEDEQDYGVVGIKIKVIE